MNDQNGARHSSVHRRLEWCEAQASSMKAAAAAAMWEEAWKQCVRRLTEHASTDDGAEDVADGGEQGACIGKVW